jgi:hypothetical protein
MNLLEFIDGVTMQLFGVSVHAMGTASIGAIASFAYGKTEQSRPRLFGLVVANTFVGALSVAILPIWLGWVWVTPVLQAPLAGGMAFAARFAVPALIDVFPSWLRKKAGVAASQTTETP